MRIIFMGTPQFAVAPLDALVRAGHEILAVYTQPPAPAGRGKRLRASPVHQRAEELGLDVRTPKSLKPAEEQARFAALDADVAVVAAYGLILRPEVLAAPERGCINIHASLLPRWRGAAPIHRAVMAGDEETGITIMQMDEGLDTGPMLARRATEIGEKTTGELTEELARIGAELIVETLPKLNSITPQAQDEALATYAPKIDKAEARIDWNREAFAVKRHIQALSPFPGAWCMLNGERVKLLRAQLVDLEGKPGEVLDDNLAIGCANGAIRPLELQRAGRPAMALGDFLRGFAVAKGTRAS